MGILSRITGHKSSEATTTGAGGHAIDKAQVLKATDSNTVNPLQPGGWTSIRTAPVSHDPRYFTKDEAKALKGLATEKVDGARQSRRAYRSLAKIEQADATVHRSHKTYLAKVADSELTKLQANGRLAKHLHAIRPSYAKLDATIDRSESSADKRISELTAKIREKF
jgi:hypothetical protein